jgi:hypothetical protein
MGVMRGTGTSASRWKFKLVTIGRNTWLLINKPFALFYSFPSPFLHTSVMLPRNKLSIHARIRCTVTTCARTFANIGARTQHYNRDHRLKPQSTPSHNDEDVPNEQDVRMDDIPYEGHGGDDAADSGIKVGKVPHPDLNGTLNLFSKITFTQCVSRYSMHA